MVSMPRFAYKPRGKHSAYKIGCGLYIANAVGSMVLIPLPLLLSNSPKIWAVLTGNGTQAKPR
jgi:hypothetical protein